MLLLNILNTPGVGRTVGWEDGRLKVGMETPCILWLFLKFLGYQCVETYSSNACAKVSVDEHGIYSLHLVVVKHFDGFRRSEWNF